MKSELIHFFENVAVPKAQCSQALACEIGVALVQLDFIFGGAQFGHERSLHDTVVWAQSWIVHVRTAFQRVRAVKKNATKSKPRTEQMAALLR